MSADVEVNSDAKTMKRKPVTDSYYIHFRGEFVCVQKAVPFKIDRFEDAEERHNPGCAVAVANVAIARIEQGDGCEVR